MNDFKPTPADKFAFGIWGVQNRGRDPFGDATRPAMSAVDAIRGLAQRGCYGFEFHDNDLYPMDATAAQKEAAIRDVQKVMADTGIKATMATTNLFYHPVFHDGAFTSTDPAVRLFATQKVMHCLDVAAQLGAGIFVFWGGREGVEVDAAKDPITCAGWFREALNFLSEYVIANGYDIKLSLEPKPNEPRGDLYLPTVGSMLAFIATLDHPEMVGVNPETAHIKMAGLNPYHEFAQALDAGKLLDVHLNGQKPLRFDQDLSFGSDDLREAFFTIKLLMDHDYQGTLGFDCHPYRTEADPWDFVERNLRTAKIMMLKVRQFNEHKEIQSLLRDIHGAHPDLSGITAKYSADAAKKLLAMLFDAEQLPKGGCLTNDWINFSLNCCWESCECDRLSERSFAERRKLWCNGDMNLLVRAILGLRQRTTAGLGVTVLAVASLVAVEVLGRRSTSDLHDLLALAALMPVIALVIARHKRSPLPGISAAIDLVHRLLDSAKAITFQMGLDFRGEPPVKRGTPPIIRWSIVIMAAAVCLLWMLSAYLPQDARSVLMTVSYVGYLSLMVALWLTMIFAIFLLAFVSIAVIHDSFIHRYRGRRGPARRGVGIAVILWFGLIALMGTCVPLWFAPYLCLSLGAIYLLGAVPARRFVVQFLWRPPESIQVRSMTWGRWVTCQFILIGLGVLALMFASCGALIHGDETAQTVMPLTCLLGVCLSWLGPGLLALLCVMTVVSRQRDPSRHAVPIAHVTLHSGAAQKHEVRRRFASRGWKVRFAPTPPEPLDVRVQLAAESLPLDRPSNQWRLIITRADLEREGLFVRLARRDEIQKRRRFLSGLESLVKFARRGSRGGNGYWLSPQYWFVAGLMRDARPGDDDPEMDLGENPILSASIGPPYYRLFPRSVRKHMFDVLRGTQVDLIFFEDGIGFKKLRRALRVLFEVYDVHAGRRPAEEIDFRGLPGLRVLIHDYQFDEPFKAENYPEPKYEMLGRARIMHVFRDRGGDEELIEPPFDYDRQPAPYAVM